MVTIIPIGIVAGLTAALMFGAVMSGIALSVPLAYLAALPIAMAALGWSHVAGLIAALVAAAALAAVLDNLAFLSFLIGIGLPIWWLSYLAMLARPGEEQGTFEWYPVGRLVTWAALLGPSAMLIAIPYYGFDVDGMRNALRSGFERLLRVQLQLGPDAPLRMPDGTDPTRAIDVLIAILPPMSAIIAMLTGLMNLWLAGRITMVSGRLKRPWPALSTMTFPPAATAALAFAIVGTFLPGAPGLLASVFTASLMTAHVLLGLAVLHAITRDLRERLLILGGVCVTAVVFGWTVLVIAVFGIALLGITETLFAVRLRIARRRGLPMSFE